MARFNGVKQGVAGWTWVIVIAAAIAVDGAVHGEKYNGLAKIGGFPRLPNGGDKLPNSRTLRPTIAPVAAPVPGNNYNLLDRIAAFPRLPIGGDNRTTGSIVALAIALVAALVGAILGGLGGMRFHRNVDKACLGR